MRQDIRRSQHGAIAHWLRQAWQSVALVVLLAAGLPGLAHAQDATFKNEELDQMLAPIALYPDSLLAQVLMASTYPADVQAAVAWSKAHPDTKGDAAISQVESQEWEPSVKSLAAFPQVLAMMGAKPDDVQRLGDAFLADPARVMDRVQYLRKKAQEAGNLKSNEQQKVSAATEENKQVIIIEPAQPNTVYVPVYQPTVVYGSWWYPSYPPYYWAPPPYYYPPGGAFVSGVFWGAAIVGISNGLWGGVNWGRGDVNINVNKYNNVNVNNKISNNNNNFKHNADRRGDVPYRDSKSREQFGKKQLDGAKDREAYRGKDGRDADRAKANDALKARGADPAAGREKLQGADRDKAANAVRDSDRSRPGAAQSGADRSQAGNTVRSNDRSAGGASTFGSGSASNRTPDRGAMSGVQSSGASRASADRGRASTQSMNKSASPTRSARQQGSAPAARGGGGGGGGGRHR
jgi:hypothetical protein